MISTVYYNTYTDNPWHLHSRQKISQSCRSASCFETIQCTNASFLHSKWLCSDSRFSFHLRKGYINGTVRTLLLTWRGRSSALWRVNSVILRWRDCCCQNYEGLKSEEEKIFTSPQTSQTMASFQRLLDRIVLQRLFGCLSQRMYLSYLPTTLGSRLSINSGLQNGWLAWWFWGWLRAV